MAINKLQASLAAATNEVTVAAANINFDFTLVKCEVPKEYEELGNALSTKRKEQAEQGTTHITARRLGALFEGICPPTPSLIKAYGNRASQIAEAAKKTSVEPTNSIFAAHTGVDGTSIWAAATSSALHSEISRSSLADWDSSARSWLRTADRTKTKEQQQLMLIIANVNIPINEDMTVPSSVITAWKSALETMENLVSGMPQAVNSGPALLALSSWHLYPDLLLVGHDDAEVRFRDPLVSPGGMLTVGLIRSEKGNSHGVFWSLSLAHMNFYGHPVPTEVRLSHECVKVSFLQFTQAAFGTLLGKWLPPGSEIDSAVRFFVSFQAAVYRAATNDPKAVESQQAAKFLRNSSHWWNVMARVASSYLESSGEERVTIQRLIKLGLKRSSVFIPGSNRQPFFGFLEPVTIVRCLKGTEERIQWLRHVVSDSPISGDHPLIIQYFDSPVTGKTMMPMGEFATAAPLPDRFNKKRKRTPSTQNHLVTHQRWPFPDRAAGYPGEIVSTRDLRTFSPSILEPFQGFRFKEEKNQWEEYAATYVTRLLHHINVRQDPSLGADQQVYRTMLAISAAARIYKIIPSATVSIANLAKPISEIAWARVQESPIPRSVTLSCIVYMESGHDFDPKFLSKPFALAYEDSIYIAMQLTCDPWERPLPYEFKRVLGNVGRPGLTLLVPPASPMMRPSDPASWKIVSDKIFDGHAEDHFRRTSLHLSFTAYYVPLYVHGGHGQDNQIHILESVVSVYDSGVWVGDVDILHALEDSRIYRISPRSCDRRQHTDYPGNLISAESWEDILDPPRERFVIRASSNWVARLASTAVLAQSLPRDPSSLGGTGPGIVICSNNVCRSCNGLVSHIPEKIGIKSIRVFIH
ncbi:hypothetical protein EV356DRAFT_519402 [Viridothelium virens]|uniref:Uncharacterized protein n=1 Tax=Viridothelium virens TaxID=1048519 RepID=A0A6A6GYH1_VIRVR|nr:hypothetical protein EV356DRAFT_519402 [Viridothelium virens]